MTVTTLPVATDAGNPIDIELGATDTQRVAARTVVVYGESGVGKSTNLMFAAKWLYERFGKPIRLIAAEDSSKIIFQPLVNVGVIEPLFLTKSTHPLRSLRKLSQGQWPVFDGLGKLQEWHPWDNSACAYIIEGLTSFSESILEFLRENHLFLREQRSDAVEVGGEKIAAASQSAYGVTQSEMFAVLKAFANIAGIERVLWSAHEVGAIEDGTGLKIRGPALVGSAKTSHVQKHIGTLLHFDSVIANGNAEPRVYYVRHPDPSFPNVTYPAKTTLPPDAVGKLHEAFPGGYFAPSLTRGLDEFLRVENELLLASTSAVADWKRAADSLRQSGRER